MRTHMCMGTQEGGGGEPTARTPHMAARMAEADEWDAGLAWPLTGGVLH